MDVAARAWLGLLVLAALMGVVLFGCAGTMDYRVAWVYLGVFFAGSALITLYLMKHDRALLERRVNAGPWAEPRIMQRVIMSLAAIGFGATIALPALNRRFEWTSLPLEWIVVGDVLTALGLVVVFFVYRENTFTSGTIDVAAEQRVIDTGPYAFVRHPMYAGAVLLLIGTPLALGFAWGLVTLVIIIPALTWRMMDEEAFLSKALPGYSSYCARVRWRLIPGIF